MTAMPFFLFLLPEFKLTLLLGFTLFAALLFALGFHFLPLLLEGLLRFCADPGVRELLSRVSLTAFRVVRRLPDAGFNGGAE